MAKKKTSIQTQQGVGWAERYKARANTDWWMGIDNFPLMSGLLVGRINWPQGDVDRVVALGAVGAEEVFAKARPIILQNPQVHAWITLNEASIWNPIVRLGYPAFNRRMTELLAGMGKKHVCCNVNVGHPADYYWDAGIKAIGEACVGAYALGLHGYSWPSLQTAYADYVGRYKKIYAALRAAGYKPPPCLLTEIGLDKAILKDQPHAGYKKVPDLTPAQFAEQVGWFESQIGGDPDILGAFLFVSGAYPPWDAYGFDIPESDAMLIADQVAAAVPAPVPSTEPARGFYASQWQGTINWDQVLRDGYSYVHVRASSGHLPNGDIGLHRDANFETNWEQAGRIGLVRTAWHYFVQSLDGQAGFFRDVVGARKPEAGYLLDLEDNDITPERPARFFLHADAFFGQPVDVYTSPGWMMARGTPSWAGPPRKLWLAHWTTGTPMVPPPWKTWTWHQYVCTSGVPGFPIRVCLDRYNGTAEQLRAAYGGGQPEPPPPPEPEPEEPMAIQYEWYADVNEKPYKPRVDPSKPVTEAEFKAEFGNYRIVPNGKRHVTRMQAVTGPATAVVRVLDENGVGVPGVKVVWSWPDAPSLPGAGYDNRGIIVPTKEDGRSEWSMGLGAYYFPKEGQIGPHQAWIYGGASESDYIDGFGMLGQTNHDHFDVEMRPGGVTPPPPDEKYTLSVAITGLGNVIAAPNQSSYADGTIVTLTAFPATGWAFAGWSGAVNSVEVSVSLQMTANKSVVALFLETSDPVAALIAAARQYLATAAESVDRADDKLAQAEAIR